MSLQVSYKKQILFGIMFLMIIFLTIEGFARLLDYQFVKDCQFPHSEAMTHLDMDLKRQMCYDFRDLEFVNSPYTALVPNQHFSTINVNEYGFRGSEVSKQKLDGTYRIFIIGGSTTFGTGSTSDETTIPGFLQKKYESADLPFPVEVINTGVSTGFSAGETYMVKEKLIDFEPDLLIIYDGWNDVTKQIKEYNEPVKKNLFFEYAVNLYQKYKTRAIIDSFFTDINYKTGTIAKPAKIAQTPEKVAIWKDRWKEICELGKENNFEVLVTIQPIAGSSNRTLSSFAEKNYILYDNENVLSALKFYSEALVDLNQFCIKTADLRNVFDGIEDPIYTDYVHMSDFGNEIVAQKMFELTLSIVTGNFIVEK